MWKCCPPCWSECVRHARCILQVLDTAVLDLQSNHIRLLAEGMTGSCVFDLSHMMWLGRVLCVLACVFWPARYVSHIPLLGSSHSREAPSIPFQGPLPRDCLGVCCGVVQGRLPLLRKPVALQMLLLLLLASRARRQLLWPHTIANRESLTNFV